MAICWSRKWQPTPVFLPGKSHGQRSMVGYSPWGHRESDMTERLSMHRHASIDVFSKCSPRDPAASGNLLEMQHFLKSCFFLNNFIYLFLARPGCCTGFLSPVVSGGAVILVVRGLLIEVASLVAGPGLSSSATVVVAPGLSCSAACGNLLDQGSNPCFLHWQAGSSPLSHQASSEMQFLKPVPRPSELETLWVVPSGLYFNKPSR